MLIHLKYKGQTTDLDLQDGATLQQLQDEIESTFGLAPNSKLILSGRILKDSERLLTDLGVKDGATLTLLGTPKMQVNEIQKTEETWRRRELLKQQPTVKVRKTSNYADVNTNKTRFHSITPFPESALCPHLDKRTATLQRLANDPAILDIMERRDFTVGDLTELHPHKDPTLLGLNKNGGQQICLRILTDALDGIRPYFDIRRVLCHELAHNVHSAHELPFKELDSQLAKDVVAFENDPARRGNRVGGDIVGRVYDPEVAKKLLEGSCEASSGGSLSIGQRLGGDIPSNSSPSSSEDRRNQAFEAAQRRMQSKK